MRTKENNISIFKEILAFLVDISIVYAFSILFERVLMQWIFVETILLFLIVGLLYHVIFYASMQSTLGKILFEIAIEQKKKQQTDLKTILGRELCCKIGLGLVLPIIVFWILNKTDLYYIVPRILLLNLLFGAIYYIIKREFWWDTLSKTKKIKTTNILKVNIGTSFIVFVVLFGIYGFLLFCNNNNNYSEHKFMGFNNPFKSREYPDNNNLTEYKLFLSDSLPSPENYILSLFDKYDIVVLCENAHGESTAWDLAYKVVSNPKFIEKAGHIFTEYGSARNQAKVDRFLQTTYANDTLLEKATATLMRYPSGPFYYFMKKLNQLNQNLPDSLKVQEYFTDVLPHNYFPSLYNSPLVQEFELWKRDSLMAQVVIDWYKQKQKKCLVVTNYRHAFVVNKEAQKKQISKTKRIVRKFLHNEAQYIYNVFPNITANVYLYGFKINDYYFYLPIQKGKWKAAFKNNGYKPIGFDFKGSPFGRDIFDIFPTKGEKVNFTFQDIFTGFVFCRPEEDYETCSPKYEKYAAQQELNYALEHHLLTDSLKAANSTISLSDSDQNSDTKLSCLKDIRKSNWGLKYLYLYNSLDIFIFIFLSTTSILIITFHLLIQTAKKLQKSQ